MLRRLHEEDLAYHRKRARSSMALRITVGSFEHWRPGVPVSLLQLEAVFFCQQDRRMSLGLPARATTHAERVTKSRQF